MASVNCDKSYLPKKAKWHFAVSAFEAPTDAGDFTCLFAVIYVDLVAMPDGRFVVLLLPSSFGVVFCFLFCVLLSSCRWWVYAQETYRDLHHSRGM